MKKKENSKKKMMNLISEEDIEEIDKELFEFVGLSQQSPVGIIFCNFTKTVEIKKRLKRKLACDLKKATK